MYKYDCVIILIIFKNLSVNSILMNQGKFCWNFTQQIEQIQTTMEKIFVDFFTLQYSFRLPKVKENKIIILKR